MLNVQDAKSFSATIARCEALGLRLEMLVIAGLRILDITDNPGMWSTTAPAGWVQELIAAREQLRLDLAKAREAQ